MSITRENSLVEKGVLCCKTKLIKSRTSYILIMVSQAKIDKEISNGLCQVSRRLYDPFFVRSVGNLS